MNLQKNKYFMKGEIYRIGINCFDNKGAKLFANPMWRHNGAKNRRFKKIYRRQW